VILTAIFFGMLLPGVGNFYSPNLLCCNRGTVTTGAQTDNMYLDSVCDIDVAQTVSIVGNELG
jgi:hypothetical protein